MVKLLSPLAPHIAEELWNRLGYENTLTYEPWPEYKAEYDVDSKVTVVFQTNGKVRAKEDVSKDMKSDEIELLARNHTNIQKFIEGKSVVKVIVVPNKLVNFVVKG